MQASSPREEGMKIRGWPWLGTRMVTDRTIVTTAHVSWALIHQPCVNHLLCFRETLFSVIHTQASWGSCPKLTWIKGFGWDTGYQAGFQASALCYLGQNFLFVLSKILGSCSLSPQRLLTHYVLWELGPTSLLWPAGHSAMFANLLSEAFNWRFAFPLPPLQPLWPLRDVGLWASDFCFPRFSHLRAFPVLSVQADSFPSFQINAIFI